MYTVHVLAKNKVVISVELNILYEDLHNPPSLFFFLVAIWPLTAQVWLPVKTFSR